MKLIKVSFFVFVLFLYTGSANAQWSAGSHNGFFTASAPYDNHDGGDDGTHAWTKDSSFDYGGSFICSETSTNVKVEANSFSASASSAVTSSLSGSYSGNFSENPYGQAYSEFLWQGTPGGAGSVGVTHQISHSGNVFTQAVVRSNGGDSSATAWPDATVQLQTETYHVITNTVLGVTQTSLFAWSDSYAYVSGGSPTLDPELGGDVTYVGPSVTTSTGLYNVAEADGDFYLTFESTYTTPPAIASIHAQAQISIFLTVDAEISIGSSYAEASNDSRCSLGGATEIYLVF